MTLSLTALAASCGSPSGDEDKTLDAQTRCDGKACDEDPACDGEEPCAPASCGDGVVDPGEECDDGNLIAGDGCELDCTFSCHTDEECLDDDLCTIGERCVSVAGGQRCQSGVKIECPPAERNPCMAYVCDPNAPDVGYCRASALVSCYPDEDLDNFPLLDESRRVEPEGTDCSCPEIDGVRYIHPRSDGRWDCDDTNPRHYPGAPACFRDEDEDGFPLIESFDAMREDCSCFAPFIHRREDGVWDCDDESARHHPGVSCFFDRDEDGYPSTEEAGPMDAFCACPSEAIIAREDALSDCDDLSVVIHPFAACYIDADNDGFQAPDSVGVMDTSCECEGASAPADLDNPRDCDDSNANVFPGQEQYFESGYCPGLGSEASCEDGERSFDYNCDGEETKEPLCIDSPGSPCCTNNGTSCITWGAKWLHPIPACGESGTTTICSSDCKYPISARDVACR